MLLVACGRGAAEGTTAPGEAAEVVGDVAAEPGRAASVSTAASGHVGPATVAATEPAAIEEPRFVAPPVEDDEVRGRVAAIAAELRAGRVGVDAVLGDPRYLVLHGVPTFRAMVRGFAPVGAVTMVTADEPGAPIVARLRFVGERGGPLKGRVVYAYQTDARGWYAAEAPHISGNSGDQRHARLFAYAVTDGDGAVVLRTIRPVGYPRTDLPAHIHVETEGLVSELLFEDDPRLTPEARARGEQSGFMVAAPKVEGGVTRYAAVFTVRD